MFITMGREGEFVFFKRKKRGSHHANFFSFFLCRPARRGCRMHKSRRVDVGIQGSTWAGRASTSTPWQRSKNTLVRDDWRLQNGALSPKSKDAVYNRPTRAHTSLGHQGGALSPVLSQASIGSDHHSSLKERSFGPPRSAYEAGSLSQESMSKILRTPALNASLSASKDIAPRSPSFWVQERYFTHPKQRVSFSPSPVQ